MTNPTEPLAVPMDNGYWTPWHLAERLRARVAELERGAARYRWLRDAPATKESEPIRSWLWNRPYGANMANLDDAIDAAMIDERNADQA